jgi:hypothetical protein
MSMKGLLLDSSIYACVMVSTVIQTACLMVVRSWSTLTRSPIAKRA